MYGDGHKVCHVKYQVIDCSNGSWVIPASFKDASFGEEIKFVIPKIAIYLESQSKVVANSLSTADRGLLENIKVCSNNEWGFSERNYFPMGCFPKQPKNHSEWRLRKPNPTAQPFSYWSCSHALKIWGIPWKRLKTFSLLQAWLNRRDLK